MHERVGDETGEQDLFQPDRHHNLQQPGLCLGRSGADQPRLYFDRLLDELALYAQLHAFSELLKSRSGPVSRANAGYMPGKEKMCAS